MTAVRRATSILLSAAMLLGNLVSPMTAIAEEAATEGNEGYEAAAADTMQDLPQTEAPDYLVTIPYYGEIAFLVDESHVKKRENQGDTILTYKAGDDVKITVAERDGYVLEELKLFDEKKEEQAYTWEKEDTFAFLMPESDLKLNAIFRAPVKETETIEDTSGKVVSDETAQPSEVSGATDEAASQDPPSADDPQESGTNGSGEAEQIPSEENVGINKDSSGSPELQIQAIDPETEADGFPVGGSIVRLGEIRIDLDVKELTPETSFEDAGYPQDTCRVELKSNSIQYGLPGLYDVIYRVDENTTGRFWYVVRPVRVVESTDQISDTGASQEKEDGDQASGEEDDESHIETLETEEEAQAENGTGTDKLIASEAVADEVFAEAETESEISMPLNEEIGEKQPHKVNLPETDSYTVTIEREEGIYTAGETVHFYVKSTPEIYISSVAAQLSRTVSEEVVSEENYLDLTYHEEEGGYTFEMPDEDVDIVVTLSDGPAEEDAVQISKESIDMPMMLMAAAADDDEDWDDARFLQICFLIRIITIDTRRRRIYCSSSVIRSWKYDLLYRLHR